MVILTAEVQELKANPNRPAKGTVIEARLDRTRGPIATLLVQNGTLNQADVIIAGPSIPVEITGLADVPSPGDEFNAVSDERMARELVEQRRQAEKDAAAKLNTKVTLDNLFAKMQEGEMKDLNLIVKADVQGSAEALKASLLKLSNEEVRVKVIHTGVGAINESDILLASTANAIIIGFNVRPDAAAQASAQRAKVDVRMYRVIYDAINEIEAALKGMNHRRLLCERRKGHSRRTGPGASGQRRFAPGSCRVPAALQRLRKGSGRRLRMRHVH